MRALVFGIVLVAAFVLVYPTLASYLRQEAELAQLRDDVAAARARNEDLQADLDRWDDPAYVATQARERLAYVLPGQHPYRVIDPEEVVAEAPVEEETPVVDDAGSTLPWYAVVWESVKVAGEAPAPERATTGGKEPAPSGSPEPKASTNAKPSGTAKPTGTGKPTDGATKGTDAADGTEGADDAGDGTP